MKEGLIVLAPCLALQSSVAHSTNDKGTALDRLVQAARAAVRRVLSATTRRHAAAAASTRHSGHAPFCRVDLAAAAVVHATYCAVPIGQTTATVALPAETDGVAYLLGREALREQFQHFVT